MDAAVRWANHFRDELGCVRCHTFENLTLYRFNGTVVEPEKQTIEELRWMIDRMDVWCDTCPVKVNTRVAGPGRRTRKEEACLIANARIAPKSPYDTYLATGNVHISKADLLAAVKQQPCASCHAWHAPQVLDFHYLEKKTMAVAVMARAYDYTLYDLIKEIEKCCLVCANCQKLISGNIIAAPKEKITLDERFYTSHFT